jgi:cyclin C
MERADEASASQLTFYYVSYLMALGRCARVRQCAINTAALLFRRFYRKRTLTGHDPLLVAPTVLMMASKMEECFVAASVLVRAMPRLEEELGCKTPYGVSHILEQARSSLRRHAIMAA